MAKLIINVRPDLALKMGSRTIARLATDEALDLAARLAHGAFRRIAFEEGVADSVISSPIPRANGAR